MEIRTIGFTKHSAEQFFESLKSSGVKQLIDVRLNNTSHLAGFAKVSDLPYFLESIGGISYRHELQLAPTQELLDAYKKNGGSWEAYENDFLELISNRKIEKSLDREMFEKPSVLLCSEHDPEKCHRRLVAEYLNDKWGEVDIVHL
jgi:uncharacterized protein (DUF488 family)